MFKMRRLHIKAKSGIMTPYVAQPFSSVQGEGIFAGVRQIFIRFKGCNLKCSYCDENGKYHRFAVTEILKAVKRLDIPSGLHHSISITGGEPLLYQDALKSLLPRLKKMGFRIYLETNGTLPETLAAVIKNIDIIAMDIKLPSSTGERELWNEHLEFLKIGRKRNIFIKIIVTPDTKISDMRKAAGLIKKVDSNTPLCIQPATNKKGVKPLLYGNRLLKFQAEALKGLKGVRIIPQIHKVLKLK
ncbi:MAG: 7-carboxy-7-deazaguanine synthase QueE [Candidatus Omnitrophica bacterium]|nr:7-carboxy-7-deazaguanine synthase QueE [Candidatus Omnitrophota bacterium]